MSFENRLVFAKATVGGFFVGKPKSPQHWAFVGKPNVSRVGTKPARVSIGVVQCAKP